ncbi:DUF2132 domain-containing protein [Rahnella sp. C60]|uniref:DUF2132 domain-containing protein n=1 Tax=Rahnella perminowiae TaxID=2816244 RepID=A0ABS6L7N6_9GAMM|nr:MULTISPECIES: VF530 family protein [Rahnella]UJD90299.1 DUF2132 domain-containing protein [Rahnella aquatilis]MBU9814056.1 DUF2132 domain-containing protein [Rahnella perminowiae]MBU9828108.1 DUF2132 domain-containing protein [Rahnella perminowiae]MBU9837613.1 DUF2132 domain-containing protein [Rahnella perminowiae]MCR9000588.1 VF530 family protein [Rahnella perminowiae]
MTDTPQNPGAAKDPLHGVTLEKLLTTLVDNFGWPALASQVNINCFKSDPSVKSSLKFLRRTPWARKEVETLYLDFIEGHLRPDLTRSKRRTPLSAQAPQKTKVSTAAPAADSPWNNHPLVKK